MDYNMELDTQLRVRCTLHCYQHLQQDSAAECRHGIILGTAGFSYSTRMLKRRKKLPCVMSTASVHKSWINFVVWCRTVHLCIEMVFKIPGIAIQVAYNNTNQNIGESLGEREREERKLNWTSKIPHALNICKRISCILKNHNDLACPTSGCSNLYAD